MSKINGVVPIPVGYCWQQQDDDRILAPHTFDTGKGYRVRCAGCDVLQVTDAHPAWATTLHVPDMPLDQLTPEGLFGWYLLALGNCHANIQMLAALWQGLAQLHACDPTANVLARPVAGDADAPLTLPKHVLPLHSFPNGSRVQRVTVDGVTWWRLAAPFCTLHFTALSSIQAFCHEIGWPVGDGGRWCGCGEATCTFYWKQPKT